VNKHWIIVTQVKSNRIVYFTDDADYQPHMDGDWCYCSSYLGNLPEEMTLRNCWGWRFNGGVFSDARELPKKSTKETLIDANKKVLLNLLNDKIDQIRRPFSPNCEQGHVVREKKLEQASLYLENPQNGENFELLKYVAVARNISILAAANLIKEKAKEAETVLLESERFREQMSVAISNSSTQDQLLILREWLLDKIYPALTNQFKYRIENTEPIDVYVPLKEGHRLHEMTRLKTQLREHINKKRSHFDSQYIQNEAMRRHKIGLAQKFLNAKNGEMEQFEYGVLEQYAESRGIALKEAAHLITQSAIAEQNILIQTEKVKDHLLMRIDSIVTLDDIKRIEIDIEVLLNEFS
jgi:hypothetical protein